MIAAKRVIDIARSGMDTVTGAKPAPRVPEVAAGAGPAGGAPPRGAKLKAAKKAPKQVAGAKKVAGAKIIKKKPTGKVPGKKITTAV